MSKKQRNRELRAVRTIQASNEAMWTKALDFILRLPSLLAAAERQWARVAGESVEQLKREGWL